MSTKTEIYCNSIARRHHLLLTKTDEFDKMGEYDEMDAFVKADEDLEMNDENNEMRSMKVINE